MVSKQVKLAKIFFFLILILPLLVVAHEDEVVEQHVEGDTHSEEVHSDGDEVERASDLEQSIKSTSLRLIIISSGGIILLMFYAIFSNRATTNNNRLKIITFSLIVLITVGATIYVVGSTIYLNVISETKGPVHWHADFEVWNCGEKLDLADPSGLANRVGTSTFHEHGDDRIHLEGVVVKYGDVSLHSFFHVIGGQLEDDSLSIPTNDGIIELQNGDQCNGKEGKLQVFVYNVNNPDERKQWVYEQTKLDDYENYVLSPFSNVPPGDCIIVEYDVAKDSTDKICETYKIAVDRGELSGS